MLEQASGRNCGPMGDRHWSTLFLKDCTPWKGPMLEQFLKNCSSWVGSMLEKFVEDCVPWVRLHAGAGEGMRRKEQQKQRVMN